MGWGINENNNYFCVIGTNEYGEEGDECVGEFVSNADGTWAIAEEDEDDDGNINCLLTTGEVAISGCSDDMACNAVRFRNRRFIITRPANPCMPVASSRGVPIRSTT